MANKLDLADAQFIGFWFGKYQSTDIVSMVTGMNLTKKEWLRLKSEYPVLSNMDESDMRDIDLHFGII